VLCGYTNITSSPHWECEQNMGNLQKIKTSKNILKHSDFCARIDDEDII